MDILSNTNVLLIIVGSMAVLVVIVLYFLQKKKPYPGTTASIMSSESQEEYISLDINPLNADVLKAHLSPLSSDQPLFMHSVVNILKRAKTASDIKLIKSIIEQMSVQSDLLRKIEEYEELFYVTKGKPQDFDRRDEIKELNHERVRLGLLNDIARLADEPGTKEEDRKRELDEVEAELSHQEAIKAIRDRISSSTEEDKRLRKGKELDDMVASFERQKEAFEQNKNLPSSAKKEALRTLEETFISQLDDLKRGLE